MEYCKKKFELSFDTESKVLSNGSRVFQNSNFGWVVNRSCGIYFGNIKVKKIEKTQNIEDHWVRKYQRHQNFKNLI